MKKISLLTKILNHKVSNRTNYFVYPYKLKFHLTNLCDSKCKLCNIWQIYKKDPEKFKEELGKEDYRKILCNINKNLLILSISGGEPMLRNDFLDIISFLPLYNKNLSVLSINTNGLATDLIIKKAERVIEIIPKNVGVVICMSIYGNKEVHEKLINVKNSYEKSEKTFQQLLFLQKKHKNLTIKREFTISKYNLDNIENFIKELKLKKAKYFFNFTEESEYFENKNSDVAFNKVSKDEINNFFKIVEKNKPNFSFYENIFFKIAKKKFLKKVNLPRCYSGKSQILIDPYGNVHPCINYYNCPLGNLREFKFDIKNLLLSEKSKKILKDIRDCKNCWTPSDAYITIFQNPFSSAIKAFL